MKEMQRKTKETEITARLKVRGDGKISVQTGIGFFDHMLESLAKHALWDLELSCRGDLGVDGHHTVEDCGIVLGALLRESLYPAEAIERFGHASVVMDEACIEASLDVSGRPFFWSDIQLQGFIGAFDASLSEEFFRALVFGAHITLHLAYQRGRNTHHIVEATFKAFAVALRNALKHHERIGVPSTKGVL